MNNMNKLDKNIKRKYTFSEYDHNWKNQFSDIQKFLFSVFGSKALTIEHVGSTSVEGMKAKPLIDVLVVVEKIELFESTQCFCIESKLLTKKRQQLIIRIKFIACEKNRIRSDLLVDHSI